ncbi:MAG: hypothetical protein ACLFPF_10400, partial [Halanaerobiales bacterium]
DSRMGIDANTDDVLMAINEAIDMLNDGLIFATLTVNVTDTDLWYSLPDDYTKITQVIKVEGDKESYYYRWEYRNGEFRMFDTGNYVVVCKKMAEKLSDITDDLTTTELHRLYDQAIKFYALAWFKENDDDNDPAAEKYYNRFASTAQKAKSILVGTKSPTKVKVVRHA